MEYTADFAGYLRYVREKSPLIHNITNYVAANMSANALLALGASPLMSSEPDEMEDISAVSDSLVINIGCIEQAQLKAARMAASRACGMEKLWVLDPVGAGLSGLRLSAASQLLLEFNPSVIRGNASEIIDVSRAVAGNGICRMPDPEIRSHGVDSMADSASAIDSAMELARRSSSVVSVSGPDDYITDGREVVRVSNGHPIMPRVTAMGCTASAITAAFLSVPGSSSLDAAVIAMLTMGVAGEIASGRSNGPGSFVPAFIDALAGLQTADYVKFAKISVL